MIENEYIENLKEKFREFENKKDKIIELGVKLNRTSKSIIYSVIRGDIKSANEYMAEMDKYKEEMDKIVREEPRLYNNALISYQEYAEAKNIL
jgi:Predicted RNA-binding protein of the translin family